MSHTYRNVFDDELDNVKETKIKRIDHKHQKAKITDGAYKHGVVDDEGGYLYETPNQKKEFKKAFKRKQRKNNKNIEYDED